MSVNRVVTCITIPQAKEKAIEYFEDRFNATTGDMKDELDLYSAAL